MANSNNETSFQVIYDKYVSFYNDFDEAKKVLATSHLKNISEENSSQISHFKSVIDSKLSEIERDLFQDYIEVPTRFSETGNQSISQLKKELKEFIISLKKSIAIELHTLNPKVWLSDWETMLNKFLSEILNSEPNSLIDIHLKLISKIAEKLIIRDRHIGALNIIRFQIVDLSFPNKLENWDKLSDIIKEEYSINLGRPLDPDSPQESIDEAVSELILDKFFLNNKDKPKPTTIRDYLLNPFDDKYNDLKFDDSIKEKHKKAKGLLEKRQLFNRVKTSINNIMQ